MCERYSNKNKDDWFKRIFTNFTSFFDKFASVLIDPSLPYSASVYNRFISFNDGQLFSPRSDDAYSYLFYHKPPELTDEEIEKFQISKEILDNYKAFCLYIGKEKIKWGIDLFLNSVNDSFGN